MAIQAGNNVSFLIGSQDKITNHLNGTATFTVTPGAFYITNDTYRMYFGASTTELVTLNQGVISVASVSDLTPITGQFQYVEGGNVLCVYNGKEWVQINPDTAVTSMSTTVGAVSNNKTTISTVLTDNQDNNFGSGETNTNGSSRGTAAFSIEGENITVTVNGSTVKLKGKAYKFANTFGTNSATIQLKDESDTVRGAATIVGTSNITVDNDGNGNIRISGAEGNLVNKLTTSTTASENTGTVTMALEQSSTSAPQVSSEFKIVGGDGIKVTAGTKQLQIDAADYDLGATSTDSTANTGANIVLSKDGVNKPAVQLVAGTNVSSIKVTEGTSESDPDQIEINVTDSYINKATASKNANGFTVVMQNANTTKEQLSFDIQPEISYGETTQTVKFNNGTATLDVYTQDEVDAKITALQQKSDAMRFMGTAATLAALNEKIAANGVHNGDTYKITGTFEFEGLSVAPGDLIVAVDLSDTTGETTSPTWELIPSGDDVDEYTVNTSLTHGIQIERQTSATNVDVLGGIVIATDDTALTLGNDSTTGDGVKTIKIKHNTQSTDNTADTAVTQQGQKSLEIEAVTGVTRDGYGHVTGVTTKKYTVVDTHNSLKSVTTNVTTAAGGATVTTAVTTQTGDPKSDEFSIVSENTSLQVTASASSVSMNLVWGTF